MSRDRSWRRSQTERVIQRRGKCVQMWGFDEDHLWISQPHRLSKYNLVCDCWMCNHKHQRRHAVSVTMGRTLVPYEAEDILEVPSNLRRYLKLPHPVQNVW